MQKRKQRLDPSISDLRDLIVMQRQKLKNGINIPPDHRHPAVIQAAKQEAYLNLPACDDNSDLKALALDVNALAPVGKNSDQTQTVNAEKS
ncbi:hypothetical protein ABZP36_034266 [Zizania latifolia]